MGVEIVFGRLKRRCGKLNHAAVGTEKERWRENCSPFSGRFTRLDCFQRHRIKRQLKAMFVQDERLFIALRYG